MTSCLSLKTALVPAWQECFPFLCSELLKSFFVYCLGRLYRCYAVLVSQVCHVRALKKGMGLPAVFRALLCDLSPPLETLEGAGNRSS